MNLLNPFCAGYIRFDIGKNDKLAPDVLGMKCFLFSRSKVCSLQCKRDLDFRNADQGLSNIQ